MVAGDPRLSLRRPAVAFRFGRDAHTTRRAKPSPRRMAAAKIPGVTAILTANPYYNRPTQEGQYRHFKAVAEAVTLPVVLYNIPSRTGREP